MTYKILTPAIALAALSITSASAQTIAQWTFETVANTNGVSFSPGAGNSPGTIVADTGANAASSTASGLHATASGYSTPAGDLDPVIAALDAGASAANSSPSSHSFSSNGWSVGDYYSFTTSTLGFNNVTIAYDQTGSNTGPKDFGLSYSINGGAFSQFTTYSLSFYAWNATTATGNSYVFAGGGAFDNAGSIVFRIIDLDTVSINNGTVAAGGTDRVDNFTVVSVVPEPATLALAGLGGVAGLLALRRKN